MKNELEGRMARDAAAAPTLQEIVCLAAAAKPKIAAMLTYIADHLFDPALSIGAIRKACNLRDNSVALQFHDALGLPPARLIASWRQAVAERMLANSPLPIWQISNLIGFSSIQVFSRSFFRIKGIRPRDFRRHMHDGSEPAPSPSVPARQPDLLERLLAGEADDAEAARVIVRLLEVYPPSKREILCNAW